MSHGILIQLSGLDQTPLSRKAWQQGVQLQGIPAMAANLLGLGQTPLSTWGERQTDTPHHCIEVMAAQLQDPAQQAPLSGCPASLRRGQHLHVSNLWVGEPPLRLLILMSPPHLGAALACLRPPGYNPPPLHRRGKELSRQPCPPLQARRGVAPPCPSRQPCLGGSRKCRRMCLWWMTRSGQPGQQRCVFLKQHDEYW